MGENMPIKVACLSDLHGHYPKVPECDLLLLGGDYCAGGDIYTRLGHYHDLRRWVNAIHLYQGATVVGIAGNHDFLFERVGYSGLPPIHGWKYLQDSSFLWRGLHIYGTPWQPRFYDWAFNLDEPELEQKWSLIPDSTDILLVHGPPRGIADFSPFGQEHTGSPSLLQRILEIKPKLVVCGHIHSGYGQYQIGDTLVVSSSLVDESYLPVNPIQVVEI
jgi:Icc-related predicted phosphoesterase